MGSSAVFEAVSLDERLTQGDIVDGCPVFQLAANASPPDLDGPVARWKARVVVLTQSCDLEQSKATRVLVALVHRADDLVRKGALSASAIRDHVRRGRYFGCYFLPAASAPIDLPESVIDLRDLHTVSRDVLQHLASMGNRVCRIITPYREHLAQHFAVTYMRIGLPEPYETQP
jgi:hypothetical protein